MSNSGKAFTVRNRRSGAVWSVSFDYIRRVYHFQPLGKLAAIRAPMELVAIPDHFEQAGTR